MTEGAATPKKRYQPHYKALYEEEKANAQRIVYRAMIGFLVAFLLGLGFGWVL